MINFKKIEIVEKDKATFLTHCGTMHADEVFATAFLSFLFDVKLARVKEITDEDRKRDVIIYDIGYGKFDHHQEDGRVRENGIKYAAFGLLFDYYGKQFLEGLGVEDVDTVKKAIEQDFIIGLDAIDNGVFPSIDAPYKVKTTSDLIKLFNPSYKSGQEENEQFLKAVSLAQVILSLEIERIIGKEKAKAKVIEEINKQTGPILILDEYMPYEEVLLQQENAKDILFVMFPSNRGGYAVNTVPQDLTHKEDRLLFPKTWAGKTGIELVKETGVEGSNFCHVNRFLVTAKDKDSAYKLANLAIEIDKNGKE